MRFGFGGTFLLMLASLFAGCAFEGPSSLKEPLGDPQFAEDGEFDRFTRRLTIHGTIDFGQSVEAAFSRGGYGGWLFTAPEGSSIELDVAVRPSADSVLYLYGPVAGSDWADAVPVVSNDDYASGLGSHLSVTLRAGGTYLALVREFDDRDGSFVLSLTCGSESCAVAHACNGSSPTCPAGQFCSLAPSSACGASGESGICRPRPTRCPRDAAPVCGCDGDTYSNDCNAAARGVNVLHDGQCDDRAPLEATFEAFDAAWTAGNAAAGAALFTEDATYVTPFGRMAGRDAIEAGLAATLSGPQRGTTHRTTITYTRRVASGAFVDAVAHVSGTAPDGSAIAMDFDVTALASERDGTWSFTDVRIYQLAASLPPGSGS